MRYLIVLVLTSCLIAGEAPSPPEPNIPEPKPTEPNAPVEVAPPDTEYQQIQKIAWTVSALYDIAVVVEGEKSIMVGSESIMLDETQKDILRTVFTATTAKLVADVNAVPCKDKADCTEALSNSSKTLQDVLGTSVKDLIASEEQLRKGAIEFHGISLPLNETQKAQIESNKAKAKAKIMKALQTVTLEKKEN